MAKVKKGDKERGERGTEKRRLLWVLLSDQEITELKIRALRRGISFIQLVTDLLRDELKREQKP